ncbi:MAG: VWA domain-containing protein [Prevotellaceae bacterium]|jgi:Ca-activated chloride channel family protein|nr:VWA domain-containing protein [Prevotellaceae bacterium]
MPTFEYPKILYSLLLLIPLIAWYIYRISKSGVSMRMSSTIGFAKVKRGVRYYLRHLPFAFRCLGIACLILAIARPRSSTELENVTTEGIDIMLTLDISTSMEAMDFKPNRIEAAKSIAVQFISERQTDRMGLVVFAGESFTQCPLTTDRVTLINLLKEVKTKMGIEDGTAIGDGLATAVARLKDSDAKSRVVILLTDGENNRGKIYPLTAAEIAQTYNIRIYTIGVGAKGTAPYPVIDVFGSMQVVQTQVNIDEDLLTQMAEITGGKYFRATDNTKLVEIYDEINQMEKTKTEVDSFPVYKEEFLPYALAALGLLLLELLLRLFIFRRIP